MNPGRALYVVAVGVGWLGLVDDLPPAAEVARTAGGVVALGGGGPALTATTVLVLALAVQTVRRPSPWAPLLLFGLLAAYAGLEEGSAPRGLAGAGHGRVLAGASLLALGAGRLRAHRAPDDDRAALELACGVVAALYVLAAVAKLRAGGLAWPWRANLPMLVYERSLVVDEPLASVRAWIAHHPSWCVAGGVAVLAAELSAAAFVLPRARFAVAGVLTAMHLSLGICVGYAYLDWVAGVWGLALWTRGLRGGRTGADGRLEGGRGTTSATLGAGLLAGGL